MSKVQVAIEKAAERFAREIVSILRSATLADILAIAGKTGAPDDLAEALDPARPDGRRRNRPETGDGAPRTAARARRPGRDGRDGHAHAATHAPKKRSREEVDGLAEKVFQFLSSSEGDHAVSAIAEALKVSTTQLGLPLQRLKQAGRIEARGQKRSTVYRAP